MIGPTRSVSAPDRWIRFRYGGRVDAAARLFCLPYAGGSAMAFRDWIQASDERLEVAVVQFPGRGDRTGEPAHHAVEPLVAQLSDALLPNLDRPYALYGHSMGGHLALALARELGRIGGVRQPLALFIGACIAPAARRTEAPAATVSDADLLAWLRRLGGTPEDVLASPQLLELVLPALRADLMVLEDCRLRSGAPVPYPIHTYAGSRDPVAPASRMVGWARETRAEHTGRIVPGGHLFLADTGTAVLDLIRAQLLP